MVPEATKATPGEGLIFPESIEDRGVGVKTWIGVGRGVGGTPSYINVTCFFWEGIPSCIRLITISCRSINKKKTSAFHKGEAKTEFKFMKQKFKVISPGFAARAVNMFDILQSINGKDPRVIARDAPEEVLLPLPEQ